MPRSDPAYSFRPLTADDFPLLSLWLTRTHVRQWWGDPEKEIAGIAGHIGDPDVEPYIVMLDERPIGYLQVYRIRDTDHPYGDQPGRTVGIDQFIGEPELAGIGHGPRMIEAFCDRLFREGAMRVIVDPHPLNRHAIRAYEKAGFRAFDQRVTEDGPALMMARDRC